MGETHPPPGARARRLAWSAVVSGETGHRPVHRARCAPAAVVDPRRPPITLGPQRRDASLWLAPDGSRSPRLGEHGPEHRAGGRAAPAVTAASARGLARGGWERRVDRGSNAPVPASSFVVPTGCGRAHPVGGVGDARGGRPRCPGGGRLAVSAAAAPCGEPERTGPSWLTHAPQRGATLARFRMYRTDGPHGRCVT